MYCPGFLVAYIIGNISYVFLQMIVVEFDVRSAFQWAYLFLNGWIGGQGWIFGRKTPILDFFLDFVSQVFNAMH
jgi:sensor c-di-GMP phosphodiesterase-like protein